MQKGRRILSDSDTVGNVLKCHVSDEGIQDNPRKSNLGFSMCLREFPQNPRNSNFAVNWTGAGPAADLSDTQEIS
jgi:hypothetical protein